MKQPMKQLSSLATTPTTNTRIGVVAELPSPCRCGENLATVSSSRGQHAGGLICSGCGGHRGWLSHQEAAFIDKNIELLGNLTAPVQVRHGAYASSVADASTEGDENLKSKFVNKDGFGSLFKAKDKSNPKAPDYYGDFRVNGTDFKISAWKKTSSKTGETFLSLSVQPENEKKPADFDDPLDF